MMALPQHSRRSARGASALAVLAVAALFVASGAPSFCALQAPGRQPATRLRAAAPAPGEGAAGALEGPVSGAPSGAAATAEAEEEWSAGLFPGVRPDLIPAAPIEAPDFVDEDAVRERNAFPIPEEGLVQLSKAFLGSLFSAPTEVRRRIAPNFRFVAPVVPAEGSLSGDDLFNALGRFKILDAVPDLSPEQYDFRTDPFEPNRVWWTARGRGTNTGKVFGSLPATGRSYVSPPQAQSLTFNEKGEVTKMTIGYVMDKEVGTTGGLGGIYGILYGIGYGLPFPEAQPWRPSPLYRLLTKTGNLLNGLRNLAR